MTGAGDGGAGEGLMADGYYLAAAGQLHLFLHKPDR